MWWPTEGMRWQTGQAEFLQGTVRCPIPEDRQNGSFQRLGTWSHYLILKWQTYGMWQISCACTTMPKYFTHQNTQKNLVAWKFLKTNFNKFWHTSFKRKKNCHPWCKWWGHNVSNKNTTHEPAPQHLEGSEHSTHCLEGTCINYRTNQ